jgi:hypothetical protein
MRSLLVCIPVSRCICPPFSLQFQGRIQVLSLLFNLIEWSRLHYRHSRWIQLMEWWGELPDSVSNYGNQGTEHFPGTKHLLVVRYAPMQYSICIFSRCPLCYYAHHISLGVHLWQIQMYPLLYVPCSIEFHINYSLFGFRQIFTTRKYRMLEIRVQLKLQYTDQEMIPVRNVRNVVTLAEVMFVTIQRENILPSKITDYWLTNAHELLTSEWLKY